MRLAEIRYAGGATKRDTCAAWRDWPLIFVSHSCKDAVVANPPAGFEAERLARLSFALELRGCLVDRLDPGGDGTGRVWFDRKRLQPGDEWELSIVTALHACEAAVLLLTPDALESPWVLREATVLADRRSRWPGLRLVPVLCAGVTWQTLADRPHWAALNLTRWQPVQAPHEAVSGPKGRQDIAHIVDAVADRLEGLGTPRDPEHERWTEELRAFLDDLSRRGLKGRLHGAAQALRLKAPLEWDGAALQELARTLLQANVTEPGDTGPRYPLPEALGELIPGDPQAVPLSVAEQQFCQRLEPLAAPPGASVAVGAAGDGTGRAPPVLLRANDRRIAELAARRASCDRAWVRALSGVVGEGAGPSAADLEAAGRAVRAAALGRKRCYVVVALQTVPGENAAALAEGLAMRLPPAAALVGVVGRAPLAAPAGGSAVVVDVPEDDEAAAVAVAGYIDMFCEPRGAQANGGA